MKRFTVRATISLIGALALGSLTLAGAASAQVGSNASATGLIINGGRIAPADCPPGGGGVTNPGGTFGLVTVGALTADCTNAGANASAATVAVGTLVLQAVQSQCTTGPNGTASSSVLVVSGGGPLDNQIISAPTAIDAGPLLTVRLNEIVNEPGFRTANAVHATVLGQDIIIAQSRCSTAQVYPLQVGISQPMDLGGQPLPVAEQGSDGSRSGFFWLAAAVLLVAAQARFLHTVPRRSQAIASRA